MKLPFFSIVIPTKDRPHFLTFAIKSLLLQTETNFECIVVNNSEYEQETKDVFKIVEQDARFKYIRPKNFLPMHKSWELGISHANGNYISILVDKVMLFPNCLKMSKAILNGNKGYEMINWWSDAYDFYNETEGLQGKYTPFWEFRFPAVYLTKREIKRRLSFIRSRHKEGHLYFRGKICFGFYSKDVIKKVKDKLDTFFLEFSPDYTSLAAALSVTMVGYDIGMPGCLSINSNLSNGRRGEENVNNTINFVKLTDPTMKLIDELPLPNKLESIHNFVARDYLKVFNNFFKADQLLNLNFLFLRIQEDLNRKQKNYQIFSPIKLKILQLINNMYGCIADGFFIKKAYRKIMLLMFKNSNIFFKYKEEILHRKFCMEEHYCASPLEALDIAHKHYSSFNNLPYNDN